LSPTPRLPSLLAEFSKPRTEPLSFPARIWLAHTRIDPILVLVDPCAGDGIASGPLPRGPPLLHLNRPGKRLIQHTRILRLHPIRRRKLAHSRIRPARLIAQDSPPILLAFESSSNGGRR